MGVGVWLVDAGQRQDRGKDQDTAVAGHGRAAAGWGQVRGIGRAEQIRAGARQGKDGGLSRAGMTGQAGHQQG